MLDELVQTLGTRSLQQILQWSEMYGIDTSFYILS